MILHAQILEVTFADTSAKVRRLRAGTLPETQADAWRGLKSLGNELRHALHQFTALQRERQALAAAAGDAAGQAQASLAGFDAEWWRTWRRAARLADALMSLRPGQRAADAPTWSAEVQTLAISVGQRPDASLLRMTIQRLAAEPGGLIASGGLAGSPPLPDALFVMLALTAVLLQRGVAAP